MSDTSKAASSAQSAAPSVDRRAAVVTAGSLTEINRKPTVSPEKRRFRPGDVLRYSPRWSHCRQGQAIVLDSGFAVDTYWDELGKHNNPALSNGELDTAELEFNIGDYEQLGMIGPYRPTCASDRTTLTDLGRPRSRASTPAS